MFFGLLEQKLFRKIKGRQKKSQDCTCACPGPVFHATYFLQHELSKIPARLQKPQIIPENQYQVSSNIEHQSNDNLVTDLDPEIPMAALRNGKK